MRIWVSAGKKIAAAVMAVFLAVAAEPAAIAVPAHQAPAVQMMHPMSHGMPCCDPSIARHKHGTPCKDMGICLCALIGGAAAVIPANVPVTFPLASYRLASWHLHDAGPGITLKPDNPPPIV